MNSEFWDNKNVLITGAGGFKGSHLVEELSKTKANIISLVRDFDPQSYFMTKALDKKSTVVIGDLKDYRKMMDVLSKYHVDIIFHLGAQPLVTTALINPLETLESNIMGTVNILEAARLHSKVKGIVMVSSDKAYGPCDRLPYKETERLQGRAPYDVSKSSADLIAQMYARVFDMPITIARCDNVFGPGDMNLDRIIPNTIEVLIRNKVLDIRSDGKMIREYIYVKDCAEAYIKLAENIDKIKGEAFNIAGKNVLSVLEVVDKISNALGIPARVRILDQAKTEIPAQHLDGSKMKEMLGWEPSSNFEEVIRETFNWYKEIL